MAKAKKPKGKKLTKAQEREAYMKTEGAQKRSAQTKTAQRRMKKAAIDRKRAQAARKGRKTVQGRLAKARRKKG